MSVCWSSELLRSKSQTCALGVECKKDDESCEPARREWNEREVVGKQDKQRDMRIFKSMDERGKKKNRHYHHYHHHPPSPFLDGRLSRGSPLPALLRPPILTCKESFAWTVTDVAVKQ
ncbi:hypothetical protein IF1G_07779 [Cordyceps javanica]|uniref:Uncharacterized protein n=1 Tax=Cordyceps javanica TaxID=43265 RepID=A0A545UUQ4_9HYPO|nr:hypothetical protein IF1G_07779 [Cordyceps javanica]TQW05435.1 hypothetical protein IF2G_07372 [Cordyceps javanica]